MAEVLVIEDLPVPAAKVWELVRDFGGARKWLGGMIQKLELEGEGVGAIRTITLPGDTMLYEQLKTIDSRWIKEVRGRGLWIGVELVPEAGGARRFCEALAAKGLLCKETHEHTIRFAPPLCITREELDWAFERVAAVFDELG